MFGSGSSSPMMVMSSRSFTISAPSKLIDFMLRADITTSLSASTGSVLSGGWARSKRISQLLLNLQFYSRTDIRRGNLNSTPLNQFFSSLTLILQISTLCIYTCLSYHGGKKNNRPGEVDLNSSEVSPIVWASLHHTDLGKVGQKPPLPTQVYHYTVHKVGGFYFLMNSMLASTMMCLRSL